MLFSKLDNFLNIVCLQDNNSSLLHYIVAYYVEKVEEVRQ